MSERRRGSQSLQVAIAGAAAGVCLCSLCFGPGPRAARWYAAEYWLSDHLDSATAAGPDAARLEAERVEVAHDRRFAIPLHPPGTLLFRAVPSGPEAEFSVGLALDPRVGTRSDGVRFRVWCVTSQGARGLLLDEWISPRDRPGGAGWLDKHTRLTRCHTPLTVLELETTCDGNCEWDWARWGNPRVRHLRPWPAPPASLVLLVSVDSLRADRVGTYRDGTELMPNLRKLAADSVTFVNAFAPDVWTLPSHASLLTATDPRVHRVDAALGIPQGLETLAEAFQRSGWRTGAFVDVPWLSSRYGFGRGFEQFDEGASSLPRGDGVMAQRLLRWLERGDGRPTFAFWHMFDAHAPYGAPAPIGGRFRRTAPCMGHDPLLQLFGVMPGSEWSPASRYCSMDEVVAAYDEGVVSTDAIMGSVVSALRSVGRYESSLIAVTADHGETFGEHGWFTHGGVLTDDLIHVPLVIKLPGESLKSERLEDLASGLDIGPTLLELSGVRAPASFQGGSLLSANGRPRAPQRELVFGWDAETGSGYVRSRSAKLITAWREPRTVVVGSPFDASRVQRGEQLFNLTADPLERRNRVQEDAAGLEGLRRAYADFESECLRRAARAGAASPVAISPEALDRLRALGYVAR